MSAPAGADGTSRSGAAEPVPSARQRVGETPATVAAMPLRSPGEAAMRPSKTDLIDLLGRVLSGVVALPPGFLSEAALAERLDLDPRRMRALRRAGVVTPRRLGRGFVYTEAEARVCAVVAALGRLGVAVEEIADFLDGPCPEAACPATPPACRVQDCCRVLLDRVAERVEAEIDALRGFQAALDHAAL